MFSRMTKTELKLDSKRHNPPSLHFKKLWRDQCNGLQLAKWSDSSTKVLKTVFFRLRENIIRKLSPYCMHLKGRGGIKGSVRCIHKLIDNYPFAARFDVDSYYNSINHKILIKQLKNLNVDNKIMNVIIEYIQLPDNKKTGVGIVAGGALSTLLGAVYLSPLDAAMNRLYKKGNIFYIRYMDDIVILAKTR